MKKWPQPKRAGASGLDHAASSRPISKPDHHNATDRAKFRQLLVFPREVSAVDLAGAAVIWFVQS